jgi:hypothetical protein
MQIRSIFAAQQYVPDSNIKIILQQHVFIDALTELLQIIKHGIALNGVIKAILPRSKIILVSRYVLHINMGIKKFA